MHSMYAEARGEYEPSSNFVEPNIETKQLQ